MGNNEGKEKTCFEMVDLSGEEETKYGTRITMDKLIGKMEGDKWVDGSFTKVFRKMINDQDNCGDCVNKWIVLNGEVDPENIEPLNSVLDDNKKLFLSSGEILALTPSIRIIFLVKSLKNSTPAFVSRCGCVFIDE